MLYVLYLVKLKRTVSNTNDGNLLHTGGANSNTWKQGNMNVRRYIFQVRSFWSLLFFMYKLAICWVVNCADKASSWKSLLKHLFFATHHCRLLLLIFLKKFDENIYMAFLTTMKVCNENTKHNLSLECFGSTWNLS